MTSSVSRESSILALSSILHFLTHMNTLLFPAIVLPCSREFGAEPAKVLALGFPMFFLFGALALPAGFLADRWSKVYILKLCAAGMSLSAFAAGYSATLNGLMASLAMMGFFAAFYHPAGLGLIASQIGRQGRAHGINGVAGNLGIGAAPLLAGAILMFFNWRYVYYFSGALTLAGLLLAFILKADERANISAASRPAGESALANAKYFAILLGAMTIAGLIYRANSVSLPMLFETSGGGSLERAVAWAVSMMGRDAGSGTAAMIVSTLFLFGVLGQAYGGKLADRIDLRRGYLAFHLAGALFISAVGPLSGLPMYLACAGMIFFNQGMLPIENSLASKFIPARWISTGYGIKFTFTFGVGSFAVGQAAWAQKNGGLKNLYPIMAGEAFLAVALILWLLYATRRLQEMKNVHTPAEPQAAG